MPPSTTTCSCRSRLVFVVVSWALWTGRDMAIAPDAGTRSRPDGDPGDRLVFIVFTVVRNLDAGELVGRRGSLRPEPNCTGAGGSNRLRSVNNLASPALPTA